jgi:hypothetical protein
MAITGSGTQADPWIVTTYAELVSKAVDGGFVKVGNDINITDEYPDGGMPPLLISNTDIDGDGKVISNWLYGGQNRTIESTDSSDTTSQIHDLTIRNIIIKDNANSFCKRAEDNDSRPFFVNCNISGVSYAPLTNDNSSTLRFKNCSINCDLKNQKPFGDKGGVFDSCYVIMKSTFNANFFMDLYGKTAKDSYLELNLPNITRLDAYSMGFENCVLDVTSNASFGVGGGTSDVSIINTTHAPNCNPDGTNVKGVSDANWLDAAYLSGIGFNVG